MKITEYGKQALMKDRFFEYMVDQVKQKYSTGIPTGTIHEMDIFGIPMRFYINQTKYGVEVYQVIVINEIIAFFDRWSAEDQADLDKTIQELETDGSGKPEILGTLVTCYKPLQDPSSWDEPLPDYFPSSFRVIPF